MSETAKPLICTTSGKLGERIKILWQNFQPGDRILMSKEAEHYVRRKAAWLNSEGNGIFKVRVNRETTEKGVWVMRIA